MLRILSITVTMVQGVTIALAVRIKSKEDRLYLRYEDQKEDARQF